MSLNQLRQELCRLKANHYVCGLKTGTEIEDMDDAEIEVLRQISQVEATNENVVTLTVKTGGPEARRDMRSCLRIGVDNILAPMVESVYALSNFVDSFEELFPDSAATTRPGLAINLETITAVQALDAMIDSQAFSRLSQVTIGRGDLSKSMHLSVDDEEVMDLTRHILFKLSHTHVKTSVGGGLSTANIAQMAQRLPSNKFNTRHMVLDNCEAFRSDARKHLTAALGFEMMLYNEYAELFPARAAWYRRRSDILRTRLESGAFV